LRGDVDGELDDLAGFAVAVEDRIVGCLNPDFAAALADPLVFRRLMLSAIETGLERAVFRALAHRGRDEHGVMFALDFLKPITERIEKILIGGNDLPVHVEFDYSQGFADCAGLRKCVRRGGINA